MKEDKNMEMINKLTLLRAKQERQRKMQTKQNKVKKIIKPIATANNITMIIGAIKLFLSKREVFI